MNSKNKSFDIWKKFSSSLQRIELIPLSNSFSIVSLNTETRSVVSNLVSWRFHSSYITYFMLTK